MLFKKELHVSPEYKIARKRPEVPAEALKAGNILVDLESPRLFDMSYTLAADGYIGDVSSQIYEFLARPRAAFFFDNRREKLEEDDEWHLFWDTGPVVQTTDELAALLPDYQRIASEYRDRQVELFSYTIDLGDRPASERAADAIAAAVKEQSGR
jgi:CDP-glycerol glycerophosphotransferase (TagB/SpsB family)